MIELMASGWKFDYSYIEEEMDVAKVYFEPLQVNELRLIYEKEKDNKNIRRAAIFYKLIRYSYASGGKSFSSQPGTVRNTFRKINQANKRLAEVIIECKDFEDLIRHYDRIKAFFIAILLILKRKVTMNLNLKMKTITDFIKL